MGLSQSERCWFYLLLGISAVVALYGDMGVAGIIAGAALLGGCVCQYADYKLAALNRRMLELDAKNE